MSKRTMWTREDEKTLSDLLHTMKDYSGMTVIQLLNHPSARNTMVLHR